MSALAARLRARIRARRQAEAEAPTPAGVLDLGRPLKGCPIAVVDVETTGVDPAEARIVEVAVVTIDALGEAEPVVALSTRVRPDIPIPPESTEVHGIRDEDVAECPTWAEVALKVRELTAGRLLCAYNAPYDYQVLGAEHARHGLAEGPRKSTWSGWLDPLILAKLVDQYERGKRLADVAARRGLEVDAHGAAGDAMATALLLPRLLAEAGRLVRRGRPVRGRPTAADMASVRAYLAWQKQTALEQEREFFKFKRGQADCPWHELEGVTPPTVAPREVRGADKCRSCGAPVLWAVTREGKRMPMDPAEIRASTEGEGEQVTLVVSGQVHTGLHRDPNGAIVGRVSHWATCPAEQHRKPRHAAPVEQQDEERPDRVADGERGALFRVRRLGLGMDLGDVARVLLGQLRPNAPLELLDIEQGRMAPPLGWSTLEQRIRPLLVEAVTPHLERGLAWNEIQLEGWNSDEIKAACRAARRSA